MKKLFAIFLSLTLSMGLITTAFSKEVSEVEEIGSVAAEEDDGISLYSISGYGETANNLTNTSGVLYVPVTVTSGNGYGLTLKTFGTGTATISVKKPDGSFLRLGGLWTTAVEMTDSKEKAWHFTGVQAGTYEVHYYVINGPMQILCHIYG